VAWRGGEVASHEPGGAGWAKDGPQSNNGMHPTADTTDFMFRRGAARRVMPGVMRLPLAGNMRRMMAEVVE